MVHKNLTESSDYGFYGKTGTFDASILPIGVCVCGKTPIIKCRYYDTAGSRETTYIIKCSICDKTTSETGSINISIRDWISLTKN